MSIKFLHGTVDDFKITLSNPRINKLSFFVLSHKK
jgi:hypothetical protein